MNFPKIGHVLCVLGPQNNSSKKNSQNFVKKISKRFLETIYTKYNKSEYVHPDPLEFLYNYPRLEDREIVGLIASSLAYGTVTQILKSVQSILSYLGPHPYEKLKTCTARELNDVFKTFKHRFTTGREISVFLYAMRETIKNYGSLEQCLLNGYKERHETLEDSLTFFVQNIKKVSRSSLATLLPCVEKGSACKRLNLYLRWMIRKDAVDRGGWNLPPSKLLIPLDTHMHYFSLRYDFTERKNADIKTAREITKHFKRFNSDDPTKYDFAITRYGIRKELSWQDLETKFFK